jgi:Cytochrome P450
MFSFLLAMTMYPEVQKIIQAELDANVGTDRLPTFPDRDSLPYLATMLKEVIRCGSTTPLHASHCRAGQCVQLHRQAGLCTGSRPDDVAEATRPYAKFRSCAGPVPQCMFPCFVQEFCTMDSVWALYVLC